MLQAASPAEARAVLATVRVDRMVLELDLRAENGIEFAREIAVAFPAMAIVAMTAANGRDHEAEARAAGCALYLRKPIDVNTFSAQLHSAQPA